MSVEDILYQAEYEGIRELVFEEVRRLRTTDTKYWETKTIFETALNNVRQQIKENENIQR